MNTERWPPSRGRWQGRDWLLRLQTGTFDDPLPARRFLAQKSGKFVRRHDQGIDPHGDHALAKRLVLERARSLLVDLDDDIARRAGGRDEPDPGYDVEARKSRLDHGRNVRRDARASRPGGRERAQFVAA